MNSAIKKAVKEVCKESYDSETGEIKHSSKIIELPSIHEPPYVKLYLDDLGSLLKLPGKCTDVLHILVRRMDYDGYVSLGLNGKKRIVEELKLKNTQTIDNYLQTLKKADVIKSIGRGEFIVNPSLFAKGEWKDIYKRRKKFLELSIRYDEKGNRTLNTKTV
jgi:hypothetical protein|tara:strand:- start:2133 stop:2618 length:486 start_codon:yes stop_codon:yes gene_type:complete